MAAHHDIKIIYHLNNKKKNGNRQYFKQRKIQ